MGGAPASFRRFVHEFSNPVPVNRVPAFPRECIDNINVLVVFAIIRENPVDNNEPKAVRIAFDTNLPQLFADEMSVDGGHDAPSCGFADLAKVDPAPIFVFARPLRR